MEKVANGRLTVIGFNNFKTGNVVGNHVVFRNAQKGDAEFILDLRLDRELGKYLSRTSSELSEQIAWLENCARDNTQIYFIIEDKHGERFGTVRIYDPNGDSFCWGSWILKKERPSGFALESALMVYRFALNLGFRTSHFDVRKENRKVWQFHKWFGAMRVGEAEDDYLYEISFEAIEKAIEKYRDYLPHGIEVTNA